MDTQPLVHTCPGCGTSLDVSVVDPFSEVTCPSCNQTMRVRDRFDHFQILEFIASGGMGTVYKARDINLNRIVALKLLRKEYSEDAEYIEKLGTEAKITASVTHPYVVKVFSFGCDQGIYYIAMELVDKGSLDDLMGLQHRIAEAQVLEIGIQAAQGLRAAYRVGLIHRDVKPGNILFADAHTAKIVDFGLALPLEQAKEGEEEIWGTPYYVAPEKLNHEPEDFRSDIYSLGGTLFHALAGRPPFEADNASLVALKHLKSQVVSLQAFAPDVSSPTAYVINRMQAKNPDDRYSSYDELIEHLEYARNELLDNAGKSRQPKARMVLEDEKQQNIFGYIMLAAIVFTIILGVLLYLFRDTIIKRHGGADELARQQMEQSFNSAEQVVAQARKQMGAGNPDGALQTLKALEKRSNAPQMFRVWGPLHECAARLQAGQFQKAGEIVSGLLSKKVFENGDRDEQEQMRKFLTTVNNVLHSRAKTIDPNVMRWPTNQFEAYGFLIVGLKEWDASRFDVAVGYFQKFLTAKPKSPWGWIEEFKPLAQRYCDDYALFQPLQKLIAAADTPDKRSDAIRKIATAKGKLKLPGRLPEELAVYTAALQPAPAPASQKAVPVAVLRARVSRLLAEMRTAEASAEINATALSPDNPAAKKALAQKVAYVADLKKKLIEDLNTSGSNRTLSRRSGPILSGRSIRADDSAIQFNAAAVGTVSVPWTDVMPSTIMVWTDSLVYGIDTPSRLWLSGVYASQAGYDKDAKARLTAAAAQAKDYASSLPLFEVTP